MDKFYAADKAFGDYIKKRDITNGYFICPTCKKRVDAIYAECGHFIPRKHNPVRYDERNAHAQCESCLTPDTLVLMADFTWKLLGEIKIDDILFAFDEEKTNNRLFRKYKTTNVLNINYYYRDIYEVSLANGDKIKTTADHKWLARKGTSTGYQWIKTDSLWVHSRNLKGYRISGAKKEDVCSTVCKPFRIIHQDKSHESGWVAGMIDADGHITQQIAHDKRIIPYSYGFRIGISQSDGAIADKANILLQKFSDNRVTCRACIPSVIINNAKGKIYNPNTIVRTYLTTGTNIEKIEFIQRTRPVKLSKIDINKLGKMKSQYDTTVESIRYIGKKKIVAMETDSHTFIANGYAMHNCNSYHDGRDLEYKVFMIAKYGMDVVDELYRKSKGYVKVDKLYIKEIEMLYKEKIKLL